MYLIVKENKNWRVFAEVLMYSAQGITRVGYGMM